MATWRIERPAGAALTLGYLLIGALALRAKSSPGIEGPALIAGMLTSAAFVAVFPDSPAFFVIGPLGYLIAHATVGFSLWREAGTGARAPLGATSRAA